MTAARSVALISLCSVLAHPSVYRANLVVQRRQLNDSAPAQMTLLVEAVSVPVVNTHRDILSPGLTPKTAKLVGLAPKISAYRAEPDRRARRALGLELLRAFDDAAEWELDWLDEIVDEALPLVIPVLRRNPRASDVHLAAQLHSSRPLRRRREDVRRRIAAEHDSLLDAYGNSITALEDPEEQFPLLLQSLLHFFLRAEVNALESMVKAVRAALDRETDDEALEKGRNAFDESFKASHLARNQEFGVELLSNLEKEWMAKAAARQSGETQRSGRLQLRFTASELIEAAGLVDMTIPVKAGHPVRLWEALADHAALRSVLFPNGEWDSQWTLRSKRSNLSPKDWLPTGKLIHIERSDNNHSDHTEAAARYDGPPAPANPTNGDETSLNPRITPDWRPVAAEAATFLVRKGWIASASAWLAALEKVEKLAHAREGSGREMSEIFTRRRETLYVFAAFMRELALDPALSRIRHLATIDGQAEDEMRFPCELGMVLVKAMVRDSNTSPKLELRFYLQERPHGRRLLDVVRTGRDFINDPTQAPEKRVHMDWVDMPDGYWYHSPLPKRRPLNDDWPYVKPWAHRIALGEAIYSGVYSERLLVAVARRSFREMRSAFSNMRPAPGLWDWEALPVGFWAELLGEAVKFHYFPEGLLAGRILLIHWLNGVKHEALADHAASIRRAGFDVQALKIEGSGPWAQLNGGRLVAWPAALPLKSSAYSLIFLEGEATRHMDAEVAAELGRLLSPDGRLLVHNPSAELIKRLEGAGFQAHFFRRFGVYLFGLQQLDPNGSSGHRLSIQLPSRLHSQSA